MRTVFQLFLLITFVLFSPLVFIVLAFRMGAPTADLLKSQLVKKDMYVTVVSELHKQIDEASGDNPMVIVGPFIKKELTATYLQGKIETLIDDTENWIKGKGESPVLSFKDLKEKLVRQNRNIIAELESAMKELDSLPEQAEEGGKMPFSSKDLEKFLNSDFVIPVGAHVEWVKVLASSMYILGIILVVSYGLSVLSIILLASSIQSKLRWVGWTILLTALWNIPLIVLSAGSVAVLGTAVMQSEQVTLYVLPFVETFLTPIIASYAKITTVFVVSGGIFSVGILILSLFINPQAVTVKKKKN